MTSSIRWRLFTGVTLLIAFFVFFSWILNTNYLEKYYLSQKNNALMRNAKTIDRLYPDHLEDAYLEIESLERNSGIHVMILDSSMVIQYFSMARRKPDTGIYLLMSRQDELAQKGSISELSRDRFLKTDFLNLIYLLNNGHYLILNTPLAAIEQSAGIANRFFLYTGVITIILASILAFAFSRRFTRPILELNDIAQSMARLDFTKKYRIKTNDELEELGQSINSLSDQLNEAISDLQGANAKLKEDIERERRIDEMRKEFIYSVSHELKTPLALIQGYAEGLKVNVNEDETSKNFYCEVIMDEAAKMNKLVKELLDLSQLETGYFKLEKRNFKLSELLERLVNKYQPIFNEKNVIPQMEKQDLDLLVHADAVRVEQILVNYINNALDHLDDSRVLIIKCKKLDKKVRVSVFNSGKPIPDESLDKVFDSFYKVDRARTRAYGGTGLGLSIVKAIQGLGQNAYGVDNLAQGVEFWFEIDLAE
ncbi:MAG TPA: two-component sensor histidine kinase [Syntrophomonas sp.]|nr:two-component sensor histidine kinase [Syntrophomonas sp.]